MSEVIFRIEGEADKRAVAAPGDNLLELARGASVVIDSPCSGAGTCGKCKLQVLEGEVQGGRDWREPEEEYKAGWRLACQSSVVGDVVLLVPSEAGAFAHGIVTADLSTPEELACYQEEIEALFASDLARGVPQQGVGLAVDIGTTTVAAVLLDLQTGEVLAKASAGNDQIRYGADVINRIVNQQKPGGVKLLQDAVRANTLIPLIEQLCKQAQIKSGSISRAVIAGNTTMEHLLLGADGNTIRMEPFEPAFLEREGDTAASVGLPLAPEAPVIFAPNVGSYVGGDITAGTLTTGLWKSDQISFFIDLGTNGEMVYGNNEYMLCCACSAGPAFEGGDISCGMRATAGAIQRCVINPETMEPTLDIIGGGAPKGLCGSGIIDTVAELFRAGIVNPKGKFDREGPRVREQKYGGAEYVLAFKGELGAERDITINETDLDCFIRAKGSVYSAFCTILKDVGAESHEVDRVFIAGGIGAGINLKNAISIGMLPNIPLEKYHYIGNGSLAGACGMLLSTQAQEKVFELGRSMTYLELALDPGYMEEFVAACFLPHTNASLFE